MSHGERLFPGCARRRDNSTIWTGLLKIEQMESVTWRRGCRNPGASWLLFPVRFQFTVGCWLLVGPGRIGECHHRPSKVGLPSLLVVAEAFRIP